MKNVDKNNGILLFVENKIHALSEIFGSCPQHPDEKVSTLESNTLQNWFTDIFNELYCAQQK